MAAEKQNLQDAFLNHIRKAQGPGDHLPDEIVDGPLTPVQQRNLEKAWKPRCSTAPA
jgi:hypothetical protein